ncbi:unnamed protein product [Tetraodon nigroviridis]|uniref:(spotted green pufferfish) hypothetical protein n=1 Tax=Tetraodon nigroviridis TaxID=99883 RepID=Q4SJ74_TETNG|nr:unnamed protein product [Tetraodon nigroviridis]
MKLPALLLVSLSVAALRPALSASLNSADEDVAARQDEPTELQKTDQMEFEADQRTEATHRNATEERRVDGFHPEDQTDAGGDNTEQRIGNSNAPEDSGSSQESDETTVDLTKNQAGQCSTRGPSAEKGPVDPGSHGDQQ